MRSQQNFALVPKVSSKWAQYWRKELRAFYFYLSGIQAYEWGRLCKLSAPEITPENTWKLKAVVGSRCADTPWKRKISYRANYKDSFHRLQVESPVSSRLFVRVWIPRENERIAAWPKISVFRNTNSAVIRRKWQLIKWAIKWHTKLPNDMMSRR